MIRTFLLFLLLSQGASAQTTRILSGEHGDFTRLVVELPEAREWSFGRTALGYAFATESKNQPEYDLSGVWQRIAKSRLGSLTVDPTTGALDFELACDCHIFPFEYRPGVVVFDIKPGPPPNVSAFEAEFLRPDAAPPVPVLNTEAGSYEWLAESIGRKATLPSANLPLPLDTGTVSLDPLREELLKEISRGAADGIVDMELPGKPSDTEAADPGELPWSHIRIGEQPGLTVTDPDAFEEASTPMSECAADSLVDLTSWAEDLPSHQLLAEARSGLYGEFDATDTQAVLRSVRLHLYLGFGAEARQLAALVDDPSVTKELELYRSMAQILDDESDPQTPFAAMLDCDGPAALWAALARDRLPSGDGVNRDAILQAFLALPSHLRHHFGPGLAERFLARSDTEAARLIRDAIERTPGADMAEVALLDASADMHVGDADAAQAHAEQAVSIDGNSASGLVALVETHFTKLEPMDPEVPEALLALQGEKTGTPEGPAIDRAIVLSLALSGQTDFAFNQDAAKGSVRADLWRIVQDRAADDAFLRHSVVSTDTTRLEASPEVAQGIARRLLALGFPDASLIWIGPVAPIDPPQTRILAASAELESGDARGAVALLVGMNDPEVEALRAKALVQLGELSAASLALSAAGYNDEAARLGLWKGDWASLDPASPETWLSAASHAQPAQEDSQNGLLAQGRATVDDSLAAREAVEALLSSVPSPSDG